MFRHLLALTICASAASILAQEQQPFTDFAVLRSDRVVTYAGEGTSLNCNIVGTGDTAQFRCESHTGSGVPLVYHVALIVGSNHVGYVVSCGGGLMRRIGCQTLSAGQVVKGSVQGGKIALLLDNKTRNYRIETSSYIGPLGTSANAAEGGGFASPQGTTAPEVKRAAQVETSVEKPSQETEIRNAHAVDSPRWTKTEIPLRVFHEKIGAYESARASGFWQTTSGSKDKQLVFPIAVEIACDHDEKVCREADATVEMGILRSEMLEYDVTSWTDDGIVADDSDEGDCGIGHRLAVNFSSNSVTATDYPKKVSNDPNCKALQDASSYSLRGGQLMLYPPVPWGAQENQKK